MPAVENAKRRSSLANDNTCFACGRNNPHGLKLDIRKTDDGVELDYVPPAKFQGWRGIVHGGIVSTLLDELIAWACTARGFDAVTGELNIRFRRPMKVGVMVHGTGRITRERGKLLVGESRLTDEGGAVIAEACGKMMKA
ncbi:MAG: PaaI family thioesterase [candidate division WOR-3 bacterium]|nr:MAG: PaaI family thioesterase [candidate division WOR-3 bacterium]